MRAIAGTDAVRGEAAPIVAAAPAVVLFDWDNTLVDGQAAIDWAFASTCAEFGVRPGGEQATHQVSRRSMRDSFPELFGDHCAAAVQVFYRHFESLHLDVLRPMPGAPALIAGLAHLGVPIGVVSNKNGSYLRKEIEHLGWSDVFETTVGACDAKRDKPHPDPVFAALASTGRAGDMRRVWFVGDTDIDLQCAANSGCTAVLLRPLPPGREEFAGCRPHIHVADCLALLSTVQNLLG